MYELFQTFEVYHLVALIIFTAFYNHHNIRFQNFFNILNRNSVLIG